jgi:hypothetical protein
MGNTHKRYAPEYRQRMVELVRAGRHAEELAREFQTTSQIDSQLGGAGRSRRGPAQRWADHRRARGTQPA